MLRFTHAKSFFKHNPDLVSESRKPITFFIIRIVVLVTCIAAILFALRSRSVISSGIAAPEALRVTAASGPLTLVVNDSGDAADTNVGDGLCNSDAGTAGDQCTLRAALQETNAAATDDTITFQLPNGQGVILNNALPEIQGNVTINGRESDQTGVKRSSDAGTPDFRIFTINSGSTVAISRLRISEAKLVVPHNNGGGISNSGTLTLTNTTVRDNSGEDYGGGIYNDGTLTLTNSTVSGNVGQYGGGIFNVGTLTLTNSTVSGNAAFNLGGGICNGSGPLILTSSTVSGNTANGVGGGIANSGMLTLHNTIVAGNSGGSTADIYGPADSSSSFNLIGTGGCGGLTNLNNNQVDVSNPGLAALKDNGGPTMTHALLPGSPALEAGSNTLIANPPFSGPPYTDQRGFSRIVDGSDADATATVDIGAFEQQTSLAEIVTSTNEDTQVIVPFDPEDTSTITSVTATSDNSVLVPNDVAHLGVSGGIVIIRPANNLFGSANITVTINRTGGSAIKTIALTVNSVNDAPSFTKGEDQRLNLDAGGQSISNWATNISAGPANESNQKLIFEITSNTNPGLFTVAPAISLTGTLTYTPAAKTDGSATITVALKDDGGTANSGVDTSLQTFTITVRPDTLISFSSPTYSVSETDGKASITLTRSIVTDLPVVAKLNLTDETTSPTDYRFVPGALDTSFNPNCPGTFGQLALQPDGKILVAGILTKPDGGLTWLARLNADGSWDPTFRLSSAIGSVTSLAVRSDGKIIIGGFYAYWNRYLELLDPDGSIGGSFLVRPYPPMPFHNNGPNGPVNLIAIQQDGRIVIVGSFTEYEPTSRKGIARIGSDGTLDTSFNPGLGVGGYGFPTVYALALQPDGKIVIGGDFETYNGVPRTRLARINIDGSVDNGFVPISSPVNLHTIAVQPDGRVIAGGLGAVVRMNPDGSPDASFNAGALTEIVDGRSVAGPVNQIAIQPDGKIIVGGLFMFCGATRIDNLFRLNPDGSVDTSFNPPVGSYGPEPPSHPGGGPLALQPDGKIIVSRFRALDSVGRGCLARLDGDVFVNWAAGDVSDKTVLLPIVDDGISEPNETLTLSVVPLKGGAVVGSNPSATLTIINAHDKAAVAISAVSGSGIYYGTATLKATLTSGGMPVSGKTVNFNFHFTNRVGTTDADGVATLINVPLTGYDPATCFCPVYLVPGSYSVVASFAGDADYLPGNNTGVAIISKAASITTVTSSDNPSLLGQSVTFTARFTSLAGTPTGNAQFRVDGANAGAPVDINRRPVATFSTSSLSAGSHTISVDYSGDANFALSNGTLTQVVNEQMISFSQSSYETSEGSGFVTITVNRSGLLANPVTVDYATDDRWAPDSYETVNGWGWARCDFGTSMGTLRFPPGETQKTFQVLINRDSYTEGPEAFTINLSNVSGNGVVANPSTATVTIADETGGMPDNPLDEPQLFVRQHYHDFLNREADPSGLDFWTKEISSCGSEQACLESKRIDVSASFVLSIEFQDTGYLVERLYKTAYGDGTGASTLGGTHQVAVPTIRLREFLPDTQSISRGVVVNQPNWQQQLETNKESFIAEFVERPRFTARYPGFMTAVQFVDTLNANAGNPLSPFERDRLVIDLLTKTKTRAQVLRAIAEDPDLNAAESNRAFVLMQYFAYLQRNPDDAPDPDYTGYDFWLTKLNQFKGNFVDAELVKAFIMSGEYRQRFGAW